MFLRCIHVTYILLTEYEWFYVFINPVLLKISSNDVFLCLCYFFDHTMQDVRACGILVPRPGIQPRPSALGAQSLNRWTTREVPSPVLLTQFVSDGQWFGPPESLQVPTHHAHSSVNIRLQALTLKNFFGVCAEQQDAILNSSHPLGPPPLLFPHQSYKWVLSTSPGTWGIFHLSACC